MPKVRTVSDRGVHVTGTVREFTGKPAAGRQVIISLPGIYVWRGNIITRKQVTTTGRDGNFEFWLPPSSELVPVEGPDSPRYFIACDGVGSWDFEVPDGIVRMWMGK